MNIFISLVRDQWRPLRWPWPVQALYRETRTPLVFVWIEDTVNCENVKWAKLLYWPCLAWLYSSGTSESSSPNGGTPSGIGARSRSPSQSSLKLNLSAALSASSAVSSDCNPLDGALSFLSQVIFCALEKQENVQLYIIGLNGQPFLKLVSELEAHFVLA